MSNDLARQSFYDTLYGPTPGQPVISVFQDRHGRWVARSEGVPAAVMQRITEALKEINGH